MQFRGRSERSVILDITPLVDVVFLLLIFFMVTTTFSLDKVLDIDPPKAETGEVPDREMDRIHVTVDREGSLTLDGEPVQREQFKAALLRIPGGVGQRLVVVDADEKALHDAVVFALDGVRSVGGKRLALTTRPFPEDVSKGVGK